MRASFERVDNKTPFQVGMTKVLGPEGPYLAINPMLGINPKSKSFAKGFVFVERGVAVEIICRLVALVVARWPDTAKTFKELTDEIAHRTMPGQLQGGTDHPVVHENKPGDPCIPVPDPLRSDKQST